MNFIADRMKRIKSSATVAITARAQEMRTQGIDVISLSAGEPDLDTPEHIKQAAFEAISNGKIRYTAVDGIPELKSAISKKFKHENNLDYASDEITVASGGKQIIFNALLATLNQNDEVIIPTPYWVSYPDMVNLCGGRAKIVKTTRENSFKITPAQLEESISTQTKWLILNSPSNPTGVLYDRNELAKLGEVILKYPNLWVLSDDIYEHLNFSTQPFSTIAEVVPSLKNRCLTMNGLSKSHAMTGWRIGYAGGPKLLIGEMRKIMSQSTSCPSAIGQYGAIAALEGDQEFLKINSQIFEKRRNLVMGELKKIPDIQLTKPNGAFYIYVAIDDFVGKRHQSGLQISSDEEFAMALLEKAKVAVVFGAAFGLSPAFRISYAASDDTLIEACRRIQQFCSELS